VNCSSLRPRIGERLPGSPTAFEAPPGWVVQVTRGDRPPFRVAAPVWRIVRVGEREGGYDVVVAPFRG
jgi:hypothetical protein